MDDPLPSYPVVTLTNDGTFAVFEKTQRRKQERDSTGPINKAGKPWFLPRKSFGYHSLNFHRTDSNIIGHSDFDPGTPLYQPLIILYMVYQLALPWHPSRTHGCQIPEMWDLSWMLQGAETPFVRSMHPRACLTEVPGSPAGHNPIVLCWDQSCHRSVSCSKSPETAHVFGLPSHLLCRPSPFFFGPKICQAAVAVSSLLGTPPAFLFTSLLSSSGLRHFFFSHLEFSHFFL